MTLAMLPFVGYAYAMAYEAGYLYRFGVPFWLIHLEITHVVVSIATLAMAAVTAVLVLQAIPNRPWPLLMMESMPSLVAASIAYSFGAATDWHRPRSHPVLIALTIVSGVTSIALFIEFLVAPLVRFRNRGSVWDRWRYAQSVRAGTPASNVAEAVFLGPDRSWKVGARFFVVWLTLIGGIIAYAEGRSHSLGGQTYLVLDASPPCAVVRQYNSMLICIQFDRRTGAIRPDLRPLPATSDTIGFRVQWLNLHGWRDPIMGASAASDSAATADEPQARLAPAAPGAAAHTGSR